MKPHVLNSDLLKQFIPVAVVAAVSAALVGPAVAAKGGKGPKGSPTNTTLALTSQYIYWPNTWAPNCMTEDDVVRRSFSGSLSGSYSTSFQLCGLGTDGVTAGGEGIQSEVGVSGTLSDLTITAPDGSVTHGVYTGSSQGVSYYQVCAVPAYYASTNTGTSPLSGGTWIVSLSGSISKASWTAQVTMTDVNFQRANCPVSQQNLLQ